MQHISVYIILVECSFLHIKLRLYKYFIREVRKEFPVVAASKGLSLALGTYIEMLTIEFQGNLKLPWFLFYVILAVCAAIGVLLILFLIACSFTVSEGIINGLFFYVHVHVVHRNSDPSLYNNIQCKHILSVCSMAKFRFVFWSLLSQINISVSKDLAAAWFSWILGLVVMMIITLSHR